MQLRRTEIPSTPVSPALHHNKVEEFHLMRTWLVVAAAVVVIQGSAGLAAAGELTPPQAGKPEILPLKDVKPGMHAVAWTVFSGMTPEPIPVEIIGVWKNAMGPRQHVIMAKMGGKAERTGVAGGMSGSPVYVDGKLIGAVALRLSQFSPDAICDITPIESMLEIQDLDMSRPSDARAPNKLPAPQPAAAYEMPSDLVAQLVAA